MTEERRKMPRRRTFYRAAIHHSNRAVSLDCTVRDVSSGGMRLEVQKDTPMPEVFELSVPQLDLHFRPVRIVWARDHDIGVRFEGAPADPEPSGDRELAERVARLEHEVARLSRQLNELRVGIKRHRNED
jgi:hypothetical protein